MFVCDNEQFIKDYNELKSSRKMGEKYKVDKSTILNYAKKIGYNPKKNHTLKLTETQIQDIINRYYTDSSTALAKEYEVSKSRITQIWRQANCKGKVHRKYYFNEEYFDNIDNPDKAYWLGFIAADGCVFHPENQPGRQDSICITLQANDKEILEELNTCLHSNKPIYLTTRHTDNRQYVRLELSSNHMSNALAQYGIIPKKTYSFIFPAEKIPQEYYRDFIRGYFDGDGSISKNFDINTLHSVGITISGYYPNLLVFQKVLQKESIPTQWIEDKRDYNGEQKFGQIFLSNKTDKVNFLHYLYDNANIYLDRKYKLAQKFITLYTKNPKTWTIHKEK